MTKAHEWLDLYSKLRPSPDTQPLLDALETLVAKGRPLQVRLDQLPSLEQSVAQVRAWRERTARVFLRKNSSLTLMDVLCPRMDFASSEGGKAKRRRAAASGGANAGKDDIAAHPILQNLEEIRDQKKFQAAYLKAEKEELEVRVKQTNVG